MNGATTFQHCPTLSTFDFNNAEEIVSESLLELRRAYKLQNEDSLLQYNDEPSASSLSSNDSEKQEATISSPGSIGQPENIQDVWNVPQKRKTRTQPVKYKEDEENEEEAPEEPLWVTGKRMSWCPEGEPCKNCQDYIFEGNKFHQACIYRPKTLKKTRKTKKKQSPRPKNEKVEPPSKLTVVLRKTRNSSSSLEEQKEEATPSHEGPWCVCRSEDDSSPMIACDTCTDWLHLRCVGLTQSEADVLPFYTCPTCRNSEDVGVQKLVLDLHKSHGVLIDQSTRNPFKERKVSANAATKTGDHPMKVEDQESKSPSSYFYHTVECKRSYKYLAAIDKEELQFSSSATDSDDNFWSQLDLVGQEPMQIQEINGISEPQSSSLIISSEFD